MRRSVTSGRNSSRTARWPTRISRSPSVASILKRLMTVAQADGGNDAKRVAYLEVQGTDRYEAFDVYFPLFFPSSAPQMTLRVLGPQGSEAATIQVQPLTDFLNMDEP